MSTNSVLTVGQRAHALHHCDVCESNPCECDANCEAGEHGPWCACPACAPEVMELKSAKEIKRGEFVRRVKVCRACSGKKCAECDGTGYTPQSKTYRRGDFDRVSKKYSLTDCDDFNREVFVSGRTILQIGFTY